MSVIQLDRSALEDDDKDTVYSFSDSCSTISESAPTPTAGLSDPGNTAAGAGESATFPRTVQLRPTSSFLDDTSKTTAFLTETLLVVRAHVRWHIRTAAAVESSQVSLRHRSLSSSSSLLDMARSSSTLGAPRRASHGAPPSTTPWLALSCALPPPSQWKGRQRVTLDIGRSLLGACMTVTAGAAVSRDSQVEQFVAPTVSRRHAQLSFVLSQNNGVTGALGAHGEASHADNWQCEGFEVMDWVSATQFRGVPLSPMHRYHFPVATSGLVVDNWVANPAPSLADALGGRDAKRKGEADHLTTSIGIARWCTVEVTLDVPARGEGPHGGPRLPGPARTNHRQTLHLDVDTAEELDDPSLSLVDDAAPAMLVRGKGRRLVSTEQRCAARRETLVDGFEASASTTRPGSAEVGRLSEEKASRKRPTSTRARASNGTNEAKEPARKRRSTSAAACRSGNTVVFTTGIQLSTSEERRLKAAHVRVNPPLTEAPRAAVLVAQPPLNRSVKLLTVLPFVNAVVSRDWLEELMERADTNTLPDTSHFPYKEHRTANGIEATNGFELVDLLRVPPQQRQALFSGTRFFVHRDATPQDPPSNDLKSVLTACGGAIVKKPENASVIIAPSLTPTKTCWKSLATAFKPSPRGAVPLVVTRDDVFKCVLRQKPLTASTVTNRPGGSGDNEVAVVVESSPKASAPRRVSGRSPSCRLSSTVAKAAPTSARTPPQRRSGTRSSSRKK